MAATNQLQSLKKNAPEFMTSGSSLNSIVAGLLAYYNEAAIGRSHDTRVIRLLTHITGTK